MGVTIKQATDKSPLFPQNYSQQQCQVWACKLQDRSWFFSYSLEIMPHIQWHMPQVDNVISQLVNGGLCGLATLQSCLKSEINSDIVKTSQQNPRKRKQPLCLHHPLHQLVKTKARIFPQVLWVLLGQLRCLQGRWLSHNAYNPSDTGWGGALNMLQSSMFWFFFIPS